MDSVHVNSNVSHETFVSNRQRQRRGTTKCSRCENPRLETSAYCRDHHNAYRKEHRARERARIKALLAAVGSWVEPA